MEAAAIPNISAPRRRTLGRRTVAWLVAAVVVGVGGAVVLGLGSGGHAVRARHTGAAAAAPATAAAAGPGALKPHPRVVIALAPGQAPPDNAVTANESEPVPAGKPVAPPTDAQIKSELNAFRAHLAHVTTVRGRPGDVLADGRAVVPIDAPPVIASVIAAGNEIATTPYKWGGGHGAWADNGYDCSGSVSFALAGAGLLSSPLDSTGFMSFGQPGPGRWITIYASPTHVWMIVGNLRFDTSGATGSTRWQSPQRDTAGFTVRHPTGL